MNTAVTLTHALPKDVVIVQPPLVEEFNALMAAVDTLQEVVDADTCTAATETNTALCKLASKIEKARKTLTKPIDDLKKACMEKEKEFTRPMEEARAAIEQSLTAYKAKVDEERRQREFARQQEQNQATAFGEPRVTPALVPLEPQAEVGALKTRRTAHVVVDDMRQIPLEYLTVAVGVVKTLLMNGTPVPGAHLEWKDEIVA